MDAAQQLVQSGNEPQTPSAGSLQDELAYARRQAQKFERQNIRLRQLLDSFISGRDDSQGNTTPDAASCVSPAELTPALQSTYRDAGTLTEVEGQPDDLPMRHEKLQREYDLMARQARFYKKSFERRDEKYRAQKELLKDWSLWQEAERRRYSRTRRLEIDEGNGTRSAARPIMARASAPAAICGHAPGTDNHHTSSGSPSRAGNENSIKDRRDDSRALNEALRSLSSQETEDENADPPRLSAANVNQQDSSDGFEIVSERRVRSAARHSKQNAAQLEPAHAAGNLVRSRRVKEESISPQPVPILLQSHTCQSLDLDEISGQVETPSGRKRARDMLNLDHPQPPRSTLSAESTASKPLPNDLDDTTPTSTTRKWSAVKLERDENEELGRFVKPQPISGQNHGTPKTAVLQPLSANERRLPKRKPEFGDLQDGSACVRPDIKRSPEDCENFLHPNAAAKPLLRDYPPSRSGKRQKIEQNSSETTPIRAEADEVPSSTDRELAAQVKGHLGRSVRSSATVRRPARPLRELPLSELGLNDFRPNPNGPSGSGLDYAFTETVRGREARKCLPGCTDPRCCGATFAKMVEIGGVAPKAPQSLWSAESHGGSDGHDRQPGEDQRLLDHFIGRNDAAKRRISAMTPAERTRALIDARASLLAQQHGKHRQAFQRNPSPPGFWRTDMPSTQELEQDRAAQDILTRQRVRERWEDAIKGGKQARWVFRDELRK